MTMTMAQPMASIVRPGKRRQKRCHHADLHFVSAFEKGGCDERGQNRYGNGVQSRLHARRDGFHPRHQHITADAGQIGGDGGERDQDQRIGVQHVAHGVFTPLSEFAVPFGFGG
jgi:hypothetical protein